MQPFKLRVPSTTAFLISFKRFVLSEGFESKLLKTEMFTDNVEMISSEYFFPVSEE